jgi:hypothetical protein
MTFEEVTARIMVADAAEKARRVFSDMEVLRLWDSGENKGGR